MEAAKPVFFNKSLYETPNPYLLGAEDEEDEKDKVMVEIKSFDIEFNNDDYLLELAKSENNKKIILKICNKKQKHLKYYIAYFSLNAIYNLDGFFKFYDDINIIYNILLEAITNKKYLIEVKSELLNLILKFTIPGGKVIDVTFPLKEERLKREDLMDELYAMITQVTEENKQLKEEINTLRETINNLSNEIIFLKEEDIRIKEQIKMFEETATAKKKKKKREKNEIIEEEEINHNNIEKVEKKENIINEKENEEEEYKFFTNTPQEQENAKKEEKNEENKKNEEKKEKKEKKPKKIINIDNVFNESKIIVNEEDKQNLVNWISSKGDISQIKLIYRATENGDDSESFFKKCSNMGPTVSLIKTKEDRKFGGFTKAEWTDQKGRIKLRDENAFLFSLDNKSKYDVVKPDIAISCYPEAYTLVYGNKDDRYGIRLFSRFLSKKNYENLSSGVYNASSEYCLSGSNKFEVEDVEVFQVIFE
jgi:hypothetical protein